MKRDRGGESCDAGHLPWLCWLRRGSVCLVWVDGCLRRHADASSRKLLRWLLGGGGKGGEWGEHGMGGPGRPGCRTDAQKCAARRHGVCACGGWVVECAGGARALHASLRVFFRAGATATTAHLQASFGSPAAGEEANARRPDLLSRDTGLLKSVCPSVAALGCKGLPILHVTLLLKWLGHPTLQRELANHKTRTQPPHNPRPPATFL